MNAKIMIIWLIMVIMFLNYAIYEKERIRGSSDSVFLSIDTVIYRSFIGDDYALLKYDIEKTIPDKDIVSSPDRGYIVIGVDDNKVAHFVRVYAGETLSLNERLIRFHKNKRSINIVPNSFFIQERSIENYKKSKYAIFNFGKSGEYVLAKLADKDKKYIKLSTI
ncbi:putative membrane protein, GDYXXLXY domain [Candidatus Ichthyocystis hellenicum]|uniref:Putative membrane protein, GDYXXLXY domain n=2 Tax=Candidatus Ichthyocystis hellenicum TaxID=1561003 RepID=A0A0S4M1U3_9BURK|nr:putative membrane protein, GDYXXLXY domain [Candidatus Ichthyocystis hellenicum]